MATPEESPDDITPERSAWISNDLARQTQGLTNGSEQDAVELLYAFQKLLDVVWKDDLS
jgi:hypothetical protein